MKIQSNPREILVKNIHIYVCGALGFELIGGWYADNYGAKVIIYSIITSFEELLEMLGIALFTYALFTHITEESNAMEISIEANLS